MLVFIMVLNDTTEICLVCLFPFYVLFYKQHNEFVKAFVKVPQPA